MMKRLILLVGILVVFPAVSRGGTRALTLEHRYLRLPVKTGAAKHRMALIVDGRVVREFEIELSDDPGWWAHLDVSAWRGQKADLRVEGLPDDSTALRKVAQADEPVDVKTIYREPMRAQFHFSPRHGWNNDPNGLVFSDGEYHLFFQHNPYGWNWGNMHWGHATSPDLVHWREQPIAIYPRTFGDWVFSGSAVVDRDNTSGWKRGEAELLVAAFTSTGRGECIAFSNDRGRTWTEFEKNPVVKHQGRDPRLLWHAPTKRWVMAVYDESDGKRWIAFYTSPDLKTWTYRSRIEGFFECPDLFELPVEGGPDSGRRAWVLTAASSEYMVGTFDGEVFHPSTPKLPGHRGRGFYAAQTFSNDPRGRVVQIGWFQTSTPGMPFNQGMSLPLRLGLRATDDGPRLTWHPVEELKRLRSRTIAEHKGTIKPGDDPLHDAKGELIELRAEYQPEASSVVTINVRGIPIVLDSVHREIRVEGLKAPIAPGKQRLTIFADRTALEILADDGLTYLPLPINLDPAKTGLSLRVEGAPIRLDRLEAFELRSIWQARPERPSDVPQTNK